MMHLDKNALVAVIDTSSETRGLIRTWFERKGIKVLAFTSAQAALFTLSSPDFEEHLSLLISDLYISGDELTGKTLADQLVRRHPGMQTWLLINRPVDMDLAFLEKCTGYSFIPAPNKKSALQRQLKTDFLVAA